MDRDTVRMILLVIGVIVIAGVYVWGRYKQRLLDFVHRRGEFDELGIEPMSEAELATYRQEPVETVRVIDRREPRISEPDLDEEDDFELDEPKPAPAAPSASTAAQEPVKSAALGAPFLIQISVIAGLGKAFQGEELRDALVDLELVHGDMGIFHRYDRDYREPLFSVASLVEPGTFPVDDIEDFETPGVVLFFQPGRVADPLAVYDDLITTGHDLATRMNGIEWDDARKPLSREKIAHMRDLLQDACA